MTDIPTLTPLPQPPQRGQEPAVFAQLADAFLDAFPDLVSEINAFGAQLVQATQERVTNDAAASYQGAANARDAALAARDAAQGYANSVNPANLVNRQDDQSVDGQKTFAKKVIASLGIRIGNIDLTGLTAAGKAMAEAADVAAQKALLGVGTVPAFGAVGSYVTAGSTALALGDHDPGETVAGSSLVVSARVNGGSGYALSGEAPFGLQIAKGGPPVNLGLSGTWRLLSRVSTLDSFYYVALWVRIA